MFTMDTMSKKVGHATMTSNEIHPLIAVMLPTVSCNTLCYHITSTATRTISLDDHTKNVPYEDRTHQSDSQGRKKRVRSY